MGVTNYLLSGMILQVTPLTFENKLLFAHPEQLCALLLMVQKSCTT